MKTLQSVLILGILINWELCSQSIGRINLSTNSSRPLRDDDNGVMFTAEIKECGDIGSYLVFKDETYVVFSNNRAFFGTSPIRITPEKLYSWFCNENVKHGNMTFVLSHQSCTTHKYSQKELRLKLEVDAPYGCELQNVPSEPDLYTTANWMKEAKPLPAVGVVAGSGMLLAGLISELKNKGENEQAHYLLAGGITILSLSYRYLFEDVPDIRLNQLNESRNRILKAEWDDKRKTMVALNNLVRNTFTIKFVIR